MSDRKGQSKYYSPDFDPEELEKFNEKLRKQRKGKGPKLLDVRMMLPMSVRCQACGEYIYKGKKFNSKKETVEGETYCGIKIYRLYFKCTRCKTIFTIKTDPKNSDYICERNVTKNAEPRKEELKHLEEEKEKRKEEEDDDIIKKLENQSKDTINELHQLELLEDMKLTQKRNEKITVDDLLKRKKDIKSQNNNSNDDIQIHEIENELNDWKLKKHLNESFKEEDKKEFIKKSEKKKKLSFL
ncbi:hypothetical protein ENUP19_0082G0163 [Entamoeba nuttalli]|uniref:Splicing factor YJU2 n=2 Tax=Entamoeba nuttalli TaxID=412467 RepID=K2G839_ENTNP|nr:hypothetical protein ENU1_161500 [Entamoeba nuttalli P19]EKE38596.1 hypothetical protein ENU1_161500 [Entamoeba nuttalli P19]|eukprot:XP_008859066.1 hypothetical protein ENU1_161500 [Entamoeba nuttalli P19]